MGLASRLTKMPRTSVKRLCCRRGSSRPVHASRTYYHRSRCTQRSRHVTDFFHIDDLKLRTAELADFITASAAKHQFATGNVTAVGFSNGANIAGALLLLRPDTLGGAVLFRGMVPLTPETLSNGPANPVLISNGKMDPLVSVEETERLAALLRSTGAA